MRWREARSYLEGDSAAEVRRQAAMHDNKEVIGMMPR